MSHRPRNEKVSTAGHLEAKPTCRGAQPLSEVEAQDGAPTGRLGGEDNVIPGRVRLQAAAVLQGAVVRLLHGGNEGLLLPLLHQRHRASAPPGAGEAGAQGARRHRRPPHLLQLPAAALVQVPAAGVAVVHELGQAPQLVGGGGGAVIAGVPEGGHPRRLPPHMHRPVLQLELPPRRGDHPDVGRAVVEEVGQGLPQQLLDLLLIVGAAV
mmetsp:Transcript_13436/g.40636  ORF Transcript_13436/g.40636 Transcript_13436/m.40636 type:complete len:210 (+) Transcript_13436:332-961(+)